VDIWEEVGHQPKNAEVGNLAKKRVMVPPIAPFADELKPAAKATETAEKAVAKIKEAAGRVPQQDLAAVLPYGITIGEVERMASQLMTLEQIAAVLRLPAAVFLDCVKRFPALRHAYEGGAASAIDRSTAVVKAAVDSGDLAAARYVLERKGGWTAPRDTQVVVMAPSVVSVDGSHVAELASMQRAIRDAPDAELA